jgi:hypothetical protein
MTTRRVGYPLVMSSVVLSVFLWGTSWVVAQGSVAQSQSAAQGTENQTPAAKSGSTAQHKAEKEKHWSGSLVDANCMVKAMSSPTGAADQNSGRANAGAPQREWLTEGPGQTPAPQMGPAQSPRQTGALPPGQNPDQNPDISQTQAAQMAQADKLDKEVRQCVATAATTAFGLVPADGQMVRLDDEGNTKAGEALRAATVEPGKPVKAKVTGILAAGDTVNVSAVEIKGKAGKHASSPASAMQGGR